MILAIKPTLGSAIRISKQIKLLTGKDILVSTTPRIVPPLIRYGNMQGNYANDTSFNSKEFINICSDKLLFSEVMKENDIYSPQYFRREDLISDGYFPLIIRTSLLSTGGRGIIICRNFEEFDTAWGGIYNDYYWTPFVNMQFELRVHVLGGEIERVFKKVKEDGYEDEFPIRNVKNGYHYSLRNQDNYPKIIDLVNKLTEIFGNNCFYGMDVGWDHINKKYFIIELNSAPNLNENTARIYAEYFIERLGLNDTN